MQAGVCQFCSVTDDQVDGDRLRWHDAGRTCCSKYACTKQFHNRVRARAAKPRSRFAEIARAHPTWGRGAIYEQLRREQRAARRQSRRKKRAA
jgi:hypothetical protein